MPDGPAMAWANSVNTLWLIARSKMVPSALKSELL
jgi:hypothetical protein